MNKDIITISKGPQFRNGKAYVLYFLLMFLILFEIISIIQGEINTSLILLPFIVLLINFVLDIQGVEIDKNKNLVREYKLNFFWKSGNWVDLKEFSAIHLDYETYLIKEFTFYKSLTIVKHPSVTNERYGNFLISLVNSDSKKNIVLAERADYQEAKTLSIKLSDKIGFKFRDIISQKVQESKKNRSKH